MLKRLTQKEAEIIRAEYAKGIRIGTLAVTFGCSYSQIWDLISGRTHKNDSYEPARIRPTIATYRNFIDKNKNRFNARQLSEIIFKKCGHYFTQTTIQKFINKQNESKA